MKKNKFDKYNFNTSVKVYNKDNIIEIIKKWIIIFYNFIISQWKYNRLAFLFVLSLIFLLIYYIHINYIKEEDAEKSNYKNENIVLNNFVKSKIKKKKENT